MIADVPTGPRLLFDGECRLCRAFATLISWGFPRGLRVLPFQREEGRRLLSNLTDEEVCRSAHLVLSDGEVMSGSDAFRALLDRLPALGPLHRRMGHRFLFLRLTRVLYQAGVALRSGVRCAAPRRGSAS
ncbi:MAG: thiol-disulfide oxidoreductase DCC family protein [Thermoplasmata archaeon]